ncbi:hypothetical protein [Actinocrispum sp. NPDC049592]|uniref:hypothetical protein n=1 Tax=Actinocrispum sp. NPDC049592 TaxID=3154835 RepID=UPI003414750E
MIRRATEALRQAGPEAVLTSHTAVRLYGCTAAELSPIHVMLRPGRRIRGRVGLTIHRGRWERYQTEVVHDLRTLSLDHALAVMLGHAEIGTALLCLNQALARHPPGFRDLVRAAVKVLPDSASRRRAEVLLVS